MLLKVLSFTNEIACKLAIASPIGRRFEYDKLQLSVTVVDWNAVFVCVPYATVFGSVRPTVNFQTQCHCAGGQTEGPVLGSNENSVLGLLIPDGVVFLAFNDDQTRSDDGENSIAIQKILIGIIIGIIIKMRFSKPRKVAYLWVLRPNDQQAAREHVLDFLHPHRILRPFPENRKARAHREFCPNHLC